MYVNTSILNLVIYFKQVLKTSKVLATMIRMQTSKFWNLPRSVFFKTTISMIENTASMKNGENTLIYRDDTY